MTATNATTSEASQVKVLVVDDEIVLADLLASALRYEGWEVTTAHTGADAVRLAREISPDLVVLDIMLPDFDGLEVLSKIRRNDPDISVLFLTAKDSIADRVEGLTRAGCCLSRKSWTGYGTTTLAAKLTWWSFTSPTCVARSIRDAPP